MKNLIKYGYFVFMVALTIFTVTLLASFTIGEKYVKYRTLTEKISDGEIDYYNEVGAFEKKLEYKDGHYLERNDEVKEIITRDGLFWKTEIDTLKTYVISRSY